MSKRSAAVLDAPATAPVFADMVIENWTIDRPKPYPKNARVWSQSAIEKVANSIREFGWRQPIVVDKDGVIVIGHLRLAAAQYLKLTHVPVHVARDLSPEKIRALRIADNRTHEEAEWNFDLLGPELLELKVANFNLDFTGFDTDEIIANIFGATGRNAGGKKTRKPVMMGEDSFEVVVTCIDEAQQAQLLERLAEEGFECRALIS